MLQIVNEPRKIDLRHISRLEEYKFGIYALDDDGVLLSVGKCNDRFALMKEDGNPFDAHRFSDVQSLFIHYIENVKTRFRLWVAEDQSDVSSLRRTALIHKR